MTNVSLAGTDGKAYQVGYSQLCNLIANLDTPSAASFLQDLLTETEQIMLVKRFAAICMFTSGHTSYRVATSLQLSKSTATRLHSQYRAGAFSHLIQHTSPQQRNELVSAILDFVLAKGDYQARRRFQKRLQGK